MKISLRCVIFLQTSLYKNFKRPLALSMAPPDRWESYTPLGSVIDGTRIFACKVPLKKSLCGHLQQRFTPNDLMAMVANRGEKLGMVMDLTYTDKYYDGVIFKQNAIKYVKIMTAGHNIPNDDIYCTFADCLSDYFDNPEQKDSVVGVHCTHGVNRTGYFICRYMIEKLNVQPEDAIVAFSKARGHPIERENYLNDLRERMPGKVTPYPEGYVKDENKYRNVKKPPSHQNKKSEHSNSRNMSTHSVHYGMFDPQESSQERAPHIRHIPRSHSDNGYNRYSNQFTPPLDRYSNYGGYSDYGYNSSNRPFNGNLPGRCGRQDHWQPGGVIDHGFHQQFDRIAICSQSRDVRPYAKPYGRTRNYQSDCSAPYSSQFNNMSSPSQHRRGSSLYHSSQCGRMTNNTNFPPPYSDERKGSYTALRRIAHASPIHHRNKVYRRSQSIPNTDLR